MEQAVSITGALLILAAYAGNQFALLDHRLEIDDLPPVICPINDNGYFLATFACLNQR